MSARTTEWDKKRTIFTTFYFLHRLPQFQTPHPKISRFKISTIWNRPAGAACWPKLGGLASASMLHLHGYSRPTITRALLTRPNFQNLDHDFTHVCTIPEFWLFGGVPALDQIADDHDMGSAREQALSQANHPWHYFRSIPTRVITAPERHRSI